MLRKAIGAVFGVLGIGSLIPAIQELVRAIFWDRVLQFMNPYLGALLGYILDYGPALLFAALTVYLLAPEWADSAIHWVRKRLNWYLISAALLQLGALVAVVLYFWDKNQGPIDWVTSTGSPISFSMRSGGPLYFSAFQLIGNSRIDEPIRIRDAYIRSDDTHRTLPLKVAGVVGTPAEPSKITIEPLGHVILIGTLPPDDQGKFLDVSLETLRREFGRFTFVFKYGNDKTIERSYTRSKVERLIVDADKEHRRMLQKQPGVRFTDN